MTKPMIRIHNSQTGEIIDREMNAEEIEQAEAIKLESEARLAAFAKAEADKAALLAKLGITADEAKLLLT